MMTRVQVPYTPVLKFDTEPMPAWGRAKNGDIVFRCTCGTLTNITRWTIDDNGDVNPSVDHTRGDVCDFHSFIHLEDWQKQKESTASEHETDGV